MKNARTHLALRAFVLLAVCGCPSLLAGGGAAKAVSASTAGANPAAVVALIGTVLCGIGLLKRPKR